MGNRVFENIKNMGIVPGTIVVSKAGHDKGKAYIVISCEEKMTRIVNGTNKTFSSPKKKRVSHIMPIAVIEEPESVIKKIGEIKCEREQNILIRKIIENQINKLDGKGGE